MGSMCSIQHGRGFGVAAPHGRPTRTGVPDNALAENLWMLIKTEGIRGRTFSTRAEANLALFEYIDGFYNSRRIQKRLGYLSPVEFEEKHYADQVATERTNLKFRQPALTS